MSRDTAAFKDFEGPRSDLRISSGSTRGHAEVVSAGRRDGKLSSHGELEDPLFFVAVVLLDAGALETQLSHHRE